MIYKGYEITAQYTTNTRYELDDNAEPTEVISQDDHYLDYYIVHDKNNDEIECTYEDNLQTVMKLIDEEIVKNDL